jgi:glycosyltransferase involved in cell wall biosynthesis
VRWLQGPRAHREISTVAASERFDLVHFDTIALTPFSRYFTDTRKSLGHHNVESHMLIRRATNGGNPVKRAYFRREGMRLEQYERRVCSQFDINIVCSDLDGERLKQISPDCRIATIENGVDCEYFSTANLPQKAHALIFVGTMNWYPNVDAVLFFLDEVWDALKSRHPQLTFDVVGSNPPASVREAARGKEGVTIHGFVDDIRPVLDAATLFVCPIRDGGGTKLKILDAFSMQKCVVAHPVACEGIDVTPAVNVEFATEPQEWVERISALLADPARRLQMGIEARQLARQRYSFDQIGERLAGLFDSVVEEGPKPGAPK